MRMMQMSSLVDRVEVSAGSGISEQLNLNLRTVAAELVPRSTRAGETPTAIIGASELQLTVGRYIDDLSEGDVVDGVTPFGEGIVGQTLAAGAGVLTLTDQRALGVIRRSTLDAPNLNSSINQEASGSVLTFSVDRSALSDPVYFKRSFTGAIKAATLSGSCFVTLIPTTLLHQDSGFARPARGVFADLLTEFAGG